MYCWASDRLGIGRTSPPPAAPPYAFGTNDYEAYAFCVHAALKRAQDSLSIVVPATPEGIFTARTRDSGLMEDGKATLRFEICREPPRIQGGKQLLDPPAEEVVQALRENLPAFLCCGYSLPEKIFAYDIPKRRIRIECKGISRL